MNRRTLTERSKAEYGTRGDVPATDELQTGCLQRIAAATEVMAQNYQQLINNRDWYRQRWQEECRRREELKRSNAALRGVVTRLKRRIKEMEAGDDEPECTQGNG